ncbi:MAG: hypothetical protein CM1200mP12_17160 [Gammaproteobacteria bacterium]|nr:MAG: hypothetical protein CM1200mP12_17160 [Gammaproteobacteria bacterium]
MIYLMSCLFVLQTDEYSSSFIRSYGDNKTTWLTEDEKVSIADRYLIPKQMKNNGIKETELKITEDSIKDLVRYFTKEAE